MIEQGFNYTDPSVKEMTDFFETKVDNLISKEDKVKSSSSSEDMAKNSKKLNQVKCHRV